MQRKIRRHQEQDNPDRWMISYADFMTLLFAFFVVMYAISSINEGKYRILTSSLTTAFNRPGSTVSAMKTEHQLSEPREPVRDAPLEKLQELARNKVMSQISREVNTALKPLIDKGVVDVTRNALWVEINIKSNILFSSGEAILQQEAVPALARLAEVLKQFPNDIQVEGYTDNVPIRNSIYPSNWELSAARAANVVHLFMNQGVAPERMSAIGFGEYRPIAANDSEQGRTKNRRVSVFILADGSARRVIDTSKSEAPPAIPEAVTPQDLR